MIMRTFTVIYETRQQGAIGVFENTAWTVDIHQSSFSDSDILRDARHQIQEAKLESRFPVAIAEVNHAQS